MTPWLRFMSSSRPTTSEVRLNLRTGAGTKFRIVGVMVTGDSVEILRRKDDWTQIESDDGRQGWIPAGYLRSQPPAELRLVKTERELERLRTQFENSSADVSKLRESNAEISGREKEQLEEIKHLTLENLNLRAGPNWPEWITGASILSVGMMVGALLRSWSRRSTPRIKL